MLCKSGTNKAYLSISALGSTIGVIKGCALMFMAWAGLLYGFTSPMLEHLYHFYKGYAPTLLGGIIGGLYGFVGGFLFGAIFALLYNFFLCHCCKKCKTTESE